MISHLVRIGGTIVLIVLCIVYPFLPGKFDPLAMPLSTMAQMLGAVGLLLVPIGVLWSLHELRKRFRKERGLSHPERGYWFAWASVIAASLVAIAVALAGLMTAGFPLGILTLLLWIYLVFRLTSRVKQLKNAPFDKLNPAPIYLVSIPIAVFGLQLMLAAPATEFSRTRAIQASTQLIREIEDYHVRHGRYPQSLLAAHPDYQATVVGIEKFHYAPKGEIYSLFFEQPRFLFHDLGIRELVVYNRRDEHVMPSHAAWILEWSPEQWPATQGWSAIHNASSRHWKRFCFD